MSTKTGDMQHNCGSKILVILDGKYKPAPQGILPWRPSERVPSILLPLGGVI